MICNQLSPAHADILAGLCRLFIILAVSSLGLVIPLVSKGYPRAFFVVKTFGAGASHVQSPLSPLTHALQQGQTCQLSIDYPRAWVSDRTQLQLVRKRSTNSACTCSQASFWRQL